MHKLLILLAVITALHACTNTKSSNDKSTANTAIPQSTGPDPSDLLKTLQGRWQNQQDSTYVLEILDTKMRHFNQGKLSGETEIEIDGSCLSMPCKIDSTDLTDGWCFLEKGQFDAQCNIVVACDKTYLRYSPVGATGNVQVFKKL